MKTVYNYLDFRRYLKEFYEDKKSQDKSYSYRVFLNRAGITSPSFLKQIISAERNLTEKAVEKFLIPLKLNKKEAQYFRSLVHFNQAKTNEEKNLHYKSLRDIAKSKKIPVLGEDLFDYYENWYTSALRELLCQHDTSVTDKDLGKMLFPNVSAAKVKASRNLLLKHKLIKKSGKKYVQTEPLITTGSEVKSMVVREFNKQMIDNAANAIAKLSPQERNIQGVTMGISESTYNLIEEEINRFQSRIMDLIDTDNSPNQVYQLNLQMFPLTQSNSKSKS
jgi:uncharacterized protein (TIGR02147 family)